jgi:hypothetical protein
MPQRRVIAAYQIEGESQVGTPCGARHPVAVVDQVNGHLHEELGRGFTHGAGFADEDHLVGVPGIAAAIAGIAGVAGHIAGGVPTCVGDITRRILASIATPVFCRIGRVATGITILGDVAAGIVAGVGRRVFAAVGGGVLTGIGGGVLAAVNRRVIAGVLAGFFSRIAGTRSTRLVVATTR